MKETKDTRPKQLIPFLPYNYLQLPLSQRVYCILNAILKEYKFRKRCNKMSEENQQCLFSVSSFPPTNEFFYTDTFEDFTKNCYNGTVEVDLTELDVDNFQIFVGNFTKQFIAEHKINIKLNLKDSNLTIQYACNSSFVRNPTSQSGWEIY